MIWQKWREMWMCCIRHAFRKSAFRSVLWDFSVSASDVGWEPEAQVTTPAECQSAPTNNLGCVVPAAAEESLDGFLQLLKRQDCSTSFKMRPSFAALQDRPQEYEQARGKYIIDNNTMQILSKDAVIMHPLPRVDEVS